MNKLIEMIGRAYGLGIQAQNNEVDQSLAEEVTSECSEFLRVWEKDWGAFESMDIIDKEILKLVQTLKGETDDSN
jgi:hypothetical protein